MGIIKIQTTDVAGNLIKRNYVRVKNDEYLLFRHGKNQSHTVMKGDTLNLIMKTNTRPEEHPIFHDMVMKKIRQSKKLNKSTVLTISYPDKSLFFCNFEWRRG